MVFRHHKPRWPLSDLIEILWLYNGEARPHERERLMPTGTAEQTSVAGVHFKPGGAFAFMRPPATDFHNAHVDLHDVWASAATDLRDRLLEAQTDEQRFLVMEECLLAQLKQFPSLHPAVGFALATIARSPETATVGDIITAVHGKQAVDWPDIALAWGYYDQGAFHT